MRLAAWPLAAALVTALLSPACGSEDTALMLEIDSSLEAPARIDRLELHVEGVETGEMLERSLTLSSPFPHTFSVLPGSHPSEPVRITLNARKGDAFVARRVVEATFIAGGVTHVPIEIYADCEGIECAVGIDCVAGRCTTGMPRDAGTGSGDAGVPAGCGDHAECDDGDPCNGAERCEGGSCVSPGTPDCDDGVACTVDSCADAACAHTPDDTLCAAGDTCDAAMGCGGRACSDDDHCADGDVCNGRESCEAGVCRTGATPDCDDGIACTMDRCDTASGGCLNEATDAICDDGLFCNGPEVCGAAGCGPGTPVDCDDGDACTDDYCSNMVSRCVRTTRDVDGDGWGDATCPESGGVPATDCNDRSGGVHPGAIEACDGTDQDCDGMIDEGCGGGCDEACPGAIDATAGGRRSVTASASAHTGSCGGAGSEALLTFDLAVTSDVFITTHGSSVDTVLYVRSCTCAGSELACNDDADGLTTSVLRLTALAPGRYNVFADTKASMTAPLSVDLYATATGGPADRCGRVVHFAGGSMSGNTCGAANDLPGGCATGSDLEGPDHVYYFVVTGSTRSITLDTCTGCTRFDTTLDVRRECNDPTSTTRVACEADGCRSSCVGGPPRHASLTRSLAPGLYYVFVDGRSGECGDYTLTASGL